ncbi:Uncharacterized iron-regulated membrane protein [Arachidicoccus rhizosphaerae]|uniref:Uncharacterized iron-regulated membrane protein n=1 Tax=Arachidicoccus rhizosphaerae TaxID=551991 RepID=A0A1H4BE67_9BACT|nr:PepSY-associated TM helix domain-containing protein [Arachidicoccus rhizosphaerae]SEA46396.1 Uncharacterized iron-regulated membrane protein [Arachidicoccus rhizosphaerae]
MQVKTARRWYYWHKWTSLVCTLFLLMLSLTGLPLIFHEEIDHLTMDMKEVVLDKNAPDILLDSLAVRAQQEHPAEHIRYVFWDADHPGMVTFDLADKPDAPPDHSHYVSLNEKTGEIMGKPRTDTLIYKILELHTDMFLGIGGKLFLGLMGILFMIALISGVMLYGPIMRKFDFGMVRKYKSKRLKWLDTHNLLGIVILAWTAVVGFTGIINAMSDVVLGLWQQGQLKEMVAPYEGQKPITRPYSSLDEALATAKKAAPNMDASIITFPGTMFSSQHHYAVFMRGKTALTARLLMPALIDAKTGTLTDIRKMPWYVNTLFISEPLHFGDYGGMTLKIIWALFDIATIIVLITGLYLWWVRRKSEKTRWNNLVPKKI